jgi:hypothetical protein
MGVAMFRKGIIHDIMDVESPGSLLRLANGQFGGELTWHLRVRPLISSYSSPS